MGPCPLEALQRFDFAVSRPPSVRFPAADPFSVCRGLPAFLQIIYMPGIDDRKRVQFGKAMPAGRPKSLKQSLKQSLKAFGAFSKFGALKQLGICGDYDRTVQVKTQDCVGTISRPCQLQPSTHLRLCSSEPQNTATCKHAFS